MKNLLKSSLLLLSIVFVYIFLFMIPTILIPVSDKLLKMLNPDEMKLFFPLLLLLAFYISFSYWLLINNTDQKKITLFLKLLLVNFIMYPLMTLLESLFWSDAFKGIETSEFIRIFYRFVITFTLFSAFLTIISKKTPVTEEHRKTKENYKRIGYKILLISLICFVIYNLFGYFVAWQFEDTRSFYTGSTEIKGFFSAMLQNISDPKFVIAHIFRGILFGIAGYFLYTLLSCSRNKTLLIMALIFGGFGFQIILPNPLFPEMVRISHFIETTLSMLVFGVVVGYVFSYRNKHVANNPKEHLLLTTKANHIDHI
jgi:hypothetical protein